VARASAPVEKSDSRGKYQHSEAVERTTLHWNSLLSVLVHSCISVTKIS
jgi:hypothetical protein